MFPVVTVTIEGERLTGSQAPGEPVGLLPELCSGGTASRVPESARRSQPCAGPASACRQVGTPLGSAGVRADAAEVLREEAPGRSQEGRRAGAGRVKVMHLARAWKARGEP